MKTKVKINQPTNIIIPADVMKAAIEEYNKKGGVYGGIDQTGQLLGFSSASHKVTNLEYNEETGEVTGDVEITNLPDGKIVEELLKQKKARFYSIGQGTVDKKENGEKVVKSDYRIISVSVGSF